MDIDKQVEEVLERYPELRYESNKKEIHGELYITGNDSYTVKIDIGKFPNFFPVVYEEGERIPRKADRHIYEGTGNCCLTTLAKEQILLKTSVKNLVDFISLIVIPYFQNNSYYELNKKYKNGEYSHNTMGIIEGYQEILKLDKSWDVVPVLNRLVDHELSKNDKCYCGSNISLKKCQKGVHKDCYRDFKLISNELVRYELNKKMNPFIRELVLYDKMTNYEQRF